MERAGELITYGATIYFGLLGLASWGGLVALLWLLYWRDARRGSPGRFAHAVELWSCFVNPALYLTLIQPAIGPHALPGTAILRGLEWSLFLCFWTARLFSFDLRLVRAITAGCVVAVTAQLAADAWLAQGEFATYPFFRNPLSWTLYLLPAFVALRFYAATESRKRLERSGFALLRGPAALEAAALFAGLSLLSFWRPSEEATRAMVLREKQTILEAAKRTGTDPKLIAALIHVTHREHQRPLRDAFERAVAAAWASDPKSNFAFTTSFDASLGLAQIKPSTLQTSIVLRRGRAPFKGTREAIPLAADWKLPESAFAGLEPPLEVNAKEEVVRTLLDSKGNIESCAWLLALYDRQWKNALRNKPEILATLYQVGLQHSHPNPDPRPNEFGKRVAQEIKSDWIQAAFGQSLR